LSPHAAAVSAVLQTPSAVQQPFAQESGVQVVLGAGQASRNKAPVVASTNLIFSFTSRSDATPAGRQAAER
jgi:hypothetical protein